MVRRSDGIAVSAMTLPDPWLTTRKIRSPPLSVDAYARIRAVVVDPFDRFIVAAALEHGLPW